MRAFLNFPSSPMKLALRNLIRAIFASTFIVIVGVELASAVQPVEQVNVNELIEKRIVSLGRLNGHVVYVTINDIIPAHVSGKRTGIVISHFVYCCNQGSTPGQLGERMEMALRTISRSDSLKLKRLSDEITEGEPGDVHDVVLNIPEKHYQKFPIDRLYVVLFEHGGSSRKSNIEGVSKAMPNLMKRASNAQVSDLIVPAIGYNNMDKNSIHFKDIVRPLFRSLLASTTPENIYVVLYEPWPTHILEEAVKAINMQWKSTKPKTR